MKKDSQTPPVPSSAPDSESREPRPQSGERVRKRRQAPPFKELFSVRTDVDTLTLLTHAAQTLAALNSVTANFADGFEGAQRSRMLAIQQLATMTEMLVCRALETVDPLQAVAPPPAPVVH
ncbi:DUF6124 family protein [Pseudomonas sp. NPDC089534]|uniref:DUF6124 family protein n=1 Tax=Pseudomonas sp. NPDC089534 TaxID=3364468 RepID=UPI0038095588